MTFKPLNEEVLAATNDFTLVTPQDVEHLRAQAAKNIRQRARILLHGDPAETRQEMLIVMGKDQYLPPHRNDRGSKTYILLEGAMVIVRFLEDGSILDYQRLVGGNPSMPFMARISRPVWHMCLYETDPVVYVEHVQGPHEGTIFANWAPAADCPDRAAYLAALKDKVTPRQADCNVGGANR